MKNTQQVMKPKFLNWIFTRWYFWIYIALLLLLNQEIRYYFFEGIFAVAAGIIIGEFIFSLVPFYIGWYIYWKGFERGANNQN